MRIGTPRWPVLATALALAACGSAHSGGVHSGGTAPGVKAPATTTIVTFGGIPGAAQIAACREDARTVQEASDVYSATHGAPAPSVDALLADGHLKAAPSTGHGYVIRYDPQSGHVSAEGACTVP